MAGVAWRRINAIGQLILPQQRPAMSALGTTCHQNTAIVVAPIFDALCRTYFQFLLVTLGTSGLCGRNRGRVVGAAAMDLALLAKGAAISDPPAKFERIVPLHSLDFKPKTRMPVVTGPGKVLDVAVGAIQGGLGKSA